MFVLKKNPLFSQLLLRCIYAAGEKHKRDICDNLMQIASLSHSHQIFMKLLLKKLEQAFHEAPGVGGFTDDRAELTHSWIL